jgi:hypothetical protein
MDMVCSLANSVDLFKWNWKAVRERERPLPLISLSTAKGRDVTFYTLASRTQPSQQVENLFAFQPMGAQHKMQIS